MSRGRWKGAELHIAHDRTSDASTPGELASVRGVGYRFAVVFALGVAFAVVLSAVALDRVGASSRSASAGSSVVVVDDSRELEQAWRSAGVRGVVLVDAARDLGYLPVEERTIPRTAGWPVRGVDLETLWGAAIVRPSLVWVAARTGVVRSVHYVLPAEVLKERISAGRAQNYPGIAEDGGSVTANDEGYVRYIDDTLPSPLAQPVVLNIDASYFVQGTPDELTAVLGDSLTSYRLITIDRAEDATDVPEAARARADEMARIVKRAVGR